MTRARAVRRSLLRRLVGSRTASTGIRRKRRPLRLEPLEPRELLANADATLGVLRYTADAGETNDVVLSPGHFFSIQDAADVAQFGLGGCVPSDFLAGMSVGIGFSTGILTFGHFAVDIGVDFSFPLFIDTHLPDGTITPTPRGLNTGSDSAFADALHKGLSNAAKGASPAVAGAPIEEDGSVYYKVGAPSGPLDEYRLFQAVVDTSSAESEIPGNSSFLAATRISSGTIVNGTFSDAAGDDKDKDFYSFLADKDEQLAVIVDNKFDNGLTSDGKDKLANTRLTLYDRDGNELASAVGFDVATAVAGLKAPAKGTYYVSIEDGGVGNGDNYRFVVIRSNSSVSANSPKVLTFENADPQAIPATGAIVSTLGVSTGDAFTRITSHPTNVEVKVNLTYLDDSALHLSLESPGGTTIDLVNTGQASGANFTDTVFRDGAAQYVAPGGAPYNDDFKPADPLDTFFDESTNGNWKLHVENTGGNVGTLDKWSLAFTVRTDQTPETANPLPADRYGVGKAPPALGSKEDVDYWKVTGVTANKLVFAVADTVDRNDSHRDQQKATLEIFGNDGATLLDNGTGVDTGPAVSGQSFDDFLDQMRDTGFDLDQLKSRPDGVVVDLKDGNDRCDASKVDLLGSSIEIHGGLGNDTILLPGGDKVSAAGDDGNDTFVVNPDYTTIGTIDGGAGSNAIVVNGTDGNDNITVKLNGSYLEITVNAVTGLYQTSNIQGLSIDGGGGDDVVTVDDSGGALGFANGIGITVEGSASQIVFTAGDKIAESNVIQVGPYPSNGASTIKIDGVTQSVEFNAIDPVLATLIYDDVRGPVEVVATEGANAITLGHGPDAGTSLLTVDHLLSIQFSGKSAVTVSGGAGSDHIAAEPGLEESVAITLNGGAGNDTLSADATLIGGPGDDILIGGLGDNTYDGGAGYDTILFQGTLADDGTSLEQTDATTLTHSITTGGVTVIGTDTFSAVEMVQVDAGSGDDSVQIKVADALVSTPASSLPFSISGEAPNASDRLTVWDDGLGDTTIWRLGPDGRSGSITVGPLAPVSYVAIEHVDIVPFDAVADGYGEDLKGRLVILPTDSMEGNNSRRVAGDFDAALAAHAPFTIDPEDAGVGLPQDEDWYRFVAARTGTFRFQLDYQTIGALSNGRPGLPGDGKLVIQLHDATGAPIAKEAAETDVSQTIGVQKDGVYYVHVTGATANVVNVYHIDLINVDTFGPQVTEVSITDHDTYNLFTQKQIGAGNVPTPLVWGLTVDVRDFVAAGRVTRFPGYAYPALDVAMDLNPGHYRLVGDANGVIPIGGVEVINDPASVGLAKIKLSFDRPLPDDRYTLTIVDGVLDPAGNGFDGDTNTVEPHAAPVLPSGDNVAGGDFVARFTVDSRPEIGAWCAGSVYVDTNGNFQLDPQNTDATNRDLTYVLGYTSDYVIAGNFAGPDGFDTLALYGKVGKQFRWMVDNNDDGTPDLVQDDPFGVVGIPVVGDFDGNPANGQEVGLFTGKEWRLDGSHDFKVGGSPLDIKLKSNLRGLPIVGDFDGDGVVDLATYSNGTFYFDLSGAPGGRDGKADYPIVDRFKRFIGVRERPVAADMDGDGITDVGLWVPDRAGAADDKAGEWYWLLSDDFNGSKRVNGDLKKTLDHEFSPSPLGQDLFGRFGNSFAVPVVGNFDPPAAKADGHPDVTAGPLLVNMVGTAGNDRFSFAPGTKADTWVVTLNGKAQTFVASSIQLAFDGRGGADTAMLAGGVGNDRATLRSGHGTLLGDGYSVVVDRVERITIDGRGGSNTLDFFGSSGNDVYVATSGQDRMSGKGFSNVATSFRAVTVDGGGGSDLARAHDAALAEPIAGDPPSIPPSPYTRAVWIHGFPQLTLKKKGAADKVLGTLDKVFAAYW